jgi:elongation factor G
MGGATRMALLSLAIDPKTAEDAQRLAHALQQLTAEDSTLCARAGQVAGQVVIGALDEQHLGAILDRLRGEFQVEAGVGRPEVVYREALTRPADGEMKHARQTGGRGEYAHVKIRLYPGEPGTGYIFENNITGGAIPTQFIKAVDHGIQDALSRGVLAGYRIEDVRVDLHDGSYHDTDSSEAAFRTAGLLAAHVAARNAGPFLLEPVMRVEAVVPASCCADVMKNMADRRGQMQSRQDCGEMHTIVARLPLAELFGYTTDLRSRTHGRGSCTMQFEAYIPVQRAGDDDGRDSLVGAPRNPAPKPRDSSVSLPEPEENGTDN